jgi:hypothetical protein
MASLITAENRTGEREMINHRRDKGKVGQAEPYPVHTLKRVDRPTTQIMDDQVPRVDEREAGFNRAGRGDFGPHFQQEYFRFVQKHPLSSALGKIGIGLRKVRDGEVASKIAPLPEDPILMAGHIKETAYFLRADLVGICELPPYAVYSHGAVSSRLGSAVIHFRHATPLFVELGHFIKP